MCFNHNWVPVRGGYYWRKSPTFFNKNKHTVPVPFAFRNP